MLGLADRSNGRRLLGHILEGDAGGVLDALAEQYRLGVDPAAIIADLMELVHAVTLLKSGRSNDDPSRSEEERQALEQWAGRLGFGELHRLWQLLLKGHGEALAAVNPRDACDMALLRAVHAASLPDPSDLARLLAGGSLPAAAPQPAPAAPAAVEEPGLPGMAAGSGPDVPGDFRALTEALFNAGQGRLADELHDCVGLVRYAPPELHVRPAVPLKFTAQAMEQALRGHWSLPWRVIFSEEAAQPTLREQEAQQERDREAAVWNHPIGQAVRAGFPDAELVGIEPLKNGSMDA